MMALRMKPIVVLCFLGTENCHFIASLKRAIIAIKLEKILLTIRFIVMIIGKPL